jgi:hypothetical protein
LEESWLVLFPSNFGASVAGMPHLPNHKIDRPIQKSQSNLWAMIAGVGFASSSF